MIDQAPALTIRSIRTMAVEVPMTYTLGTSAEALRSAPLLLVALDTEEGVTGHAYQFCYVPAAASAIAIFLQEVLRTVQGERLVLTELWDRLMRRFRLIGVQGIVRAAVAMFDVAAWDALARAAGLPLATLLGAAPRPVRAYNSCGLGLMPVGAAFYAWDHGVKRGNIQVLGAASYAAPLLSTLILIAAGFAEATPHILLACVLITAGAVLAAKSLLFKRRASPEVAGA